VSTEHVLGISAASTSLALAMARLTSALNEVAYEVRDGSLHEPVAGERFDLIVSNPPSVVSPGTDAALVYRDSGLPGDEVVRRLVSQCSRHLNEGAGCRNASASTCRRTSRCGWPMRVRTVRPTTVRATTGG
jgi:methylase of polypeptide subunit release factors